MDANLHIAGDLAAFSELALGRADLAVFRHGLRRSSIAAEIEACVESNKAPREIMVRQYEICCAKGFPDNTGILPEGGVIARQHHNSRVRIAMEECGGSC